MEALIQAIEADNEAKYGPNWRIALPNAQCWHEFRWIMFIGFAVCNVFWIYTHLLIIALPAWTLPASLIVPAAFGWFWSLRDLR